MARTAIGIDFGHAHIALVELRRGRQLQIRRASLLPVPQNAVREGQIADRTVLAEMLNEVVPTVRVNRAAVVAGISGPKLTMRTLRITETDPDEFRIAVRQEFAAVMHMSPEVLEQYVIDYHVLPSDESDSYKVLAVGILRDTVTEYSRLLRRVRLPLHVLDVEAFALPRATPVDGPACHIEIGAEYTQILVTLHGEYSVYRIIPAGMNRLTSAIATAYDISHAEAMVLQGSKHIDNIIAEAPGDRSSLRYALQEIAGGLMQTLEFFRAKQQASSVSELLNSAFLCGGGALQKGMTQLLQEELGLRVEIMHPFSHMAGSTDLPTATLDMEPLFAGAVGLAKRGIEEL